MSPIVFMRFVFRLSCIACTTIVLHSLARLRYLLGLRKNRPTDAVGLWGRWLCRIMGIRVHFLNQRKGPPGAILVANHMGFLDIPVLLSIFPAVFIIKSELLQIPVAGRALRQEGHIFVDRASADSRRRAGEELGEALRIGDPVIVFPEGRGTAGAKRLPFKPLSFILAAELQKPIEVVLLDYLPDRAAAAWDSSKPMFPQFAALLGKRNHHVGVEFLASYIPENPRADAERFREEIERRLTEYTGETWGMANSKKQLPMRSD